MNHQPSPRELTELLQRTLAGFVRTLWLHRPSTSRGLWADTCLFAVLELEMRKRTCSMALLTSGSFWSMDGCTTRSTCRESQCPCGQGKLRSLLDAGCSRDILEDEWEREGEVLLSWRPSQLLLQTLGRPAWWSHLPHSSLAGLSQLTGLLHQGTLPTAAPLSENSRGCR